MGVCEEKGSMRGRSSIASSMIRTIRFGFESCDDRSTWIWIRLTMGLSLGIDHHSGDDILSNGSFVRSRTSL